MWEQCDSSSWEQVDAVLHGVLEDTSMATIRGVPVKDKSAWCFAVIDTAFVELLEVLDEAEVDLPLHERGVSLGAPQTGEAGVTDLGRLHPPFLVEKQLRQLGPGRVDRCHDLHILRTV